MSLVDAHEVAAPGRPTVASHLSDDHYGFDVVVACTQGAINATMAQFLREYRGEQLAACYAYDESRPPQLVRALLGEMENTAGVDPFTIEDGATEDSPAVAALGDAGFDCAFRATPGAPESLDSVPDVVALDKGDSMVTFRLFFADFEVISLTSVRRQLSWSKVTQDPSAPWVFTFTVPLRSEERPATDLALPPAVHDAVQDPGPDAFSVQRLYLDLGAAALESTPTLTGVDPRVQTLIQDVVVNTYWKSLQAAGPTVALTYAVTRPDAAPNTPSVMPTSLRKTVSAYTDGNGRPTSEYDLYTLDYLGVAARRAMPDFNGFSWNWVVDPKDPPDGIIAIIATRSPRS